MAGEKKFRLDMLTILPRSLYIRRERGKITRMECEFEGETMKKQYVSKTKNRKVEVKDIVLQRNK